MKDIIFNIFCMLVVLFLIGIGFLGAITNNRGEISIEDYIELDKMVQIEPEIRHFVIESLKDNYISNNELQCIKADYCEIIKKKYK